MAWGSGVNMNRRSQIKMSENSTIRESKDWVESGKIVWFEFTEEKERRSVRKKRSDVEVVKGKRVGEVTAEEEVGLLLSFYKMKLHCGKYLLSD
jgi:hypothetical protein